MMDYRRNVRLGFSASGSLGYDRVNPHGRSAPGFAVPGAGDESQGVGVSGEEERRVLCRGEAELRFNDQ